MKVEEFCVLALETWQQSRAQAGRKQSPLPDRGKVSACWTNCRLASIAPEMGMEVTLYLTRPSWEAIPQRSWIAFLQSQRIREYDRNDVMLREYKPEEELPIRLPLSEVQDALAEWFCRPGDVIHQETA